MEIITTLRLIFGSIFVLFLPGFVWSFVFFKKNEIDVIERIAISFGLSISLVPLMVFWMNYFFNIKITQINVFVLIILLILIAFGIIKNKNKIESAAKRIML